MPHILNITNGDSAADLLRAGGVSGDVLPWRDVLHEGPVPGGLDLDQLSEVRARFIAGRGWGALNDVHNAFIERDRTLQRAAEYELVRLWFEHDLYDQLQILQILHWLFEHPLPATTRLELICTEHYLGEQSADGIAAMTKFARPVSGEQLALANAAWQVFRYDTPDEFAELGRMDTSALPYLRDAVVRIIEEYPDRRTGLGKTERRALELLENNPMTPVKLFTANQAAESRVYLGDWSYWFMLNELLAGPQPLVALEQGEGPVSEDNLQQTLTLTAVGRLVVNGQCNRADLGFPERWIGGVQWDVETWRTNQWTPQRLLS